ncbi:hypothetical protein JIN82_10170 [Persicirhabdus sediminis]|uniref:Uncharacterized protein n=1 Tax=Persicirhabdus sediminis TaxID=454144 RepID=A0A8J7SK51_9BACT|nr:hypothetical protein [Persicirhabdus sediminis]
MKSRYIKVAILGLCLVAYFGCRDLFKFPAFTTWKTLDWDETEVGDFKYQLAIKRDTVKFTYLGYNDDARYDFSLYYETLHDGALILYTYDQNIFDPSTDHKPTSIDDQRIMFASAEFSEDRKSLTYKAYATNSELKFYLNE